MKFLILLFALACTQTQLPAPAPQNAPLPPASPETPVQVPTTVKKALTVLGCSNCKPEELANIRVAETKANEVIASACFSDFMKARDLIWTNKLTPAQVVEKLVGSNITVDAQAYSPSSSAVGYTVDGKMTIWLSRYALKNYNACDNGSLLAHEIVGHKNGFYHGKWSTSSRPYTVPYSINAAFTKCCKK